MIKVRGYVTRLTPANLCWLLLIRLHCLPPSHHYLIHNPFQQPSHDSHKLLHTRMLHHFMGCCKHKTAKKKTWLKFKGSARFTQIMSFRTAAEPFPRNRQHTPRDNIKIVLKGSERFPQEMSFHTAAEQLGCPYLWYHHFLTACSTHQDRT